jgi:hypothetical protein
VNDGTLDAEKLASAGESEIENPKLEMGCGSNSMVESQPSKLLVAGSIPVSRSIAKMETRKSKVERRGDEFRFSNFEFRRPSADGPM